MPNFWPCKSLPKRNGHLDTSGVSTGQSVAYEDPDAHLHHHPLVRHHNMEVIVQKISNESKIKREIEWNGMNSWMKTIESNYENCSHFQFTGRFKNQFDSKCVTAMRQIQFEIQLTNHYCFLIEWSNDGKKFLNETESGQNTKSSM